MLMKKLGSVLFYSFFSLLLLFSLLYLGLLIAKYIVYPQYMQNKQDVCKIPALNDGFMPQGLSYAGDNVYIFSGYHGKDIELHLSENGTPKQIIAVDENGNRLQGHGGGITCIKDYVYLADNSQLVIFRLSELKNAAHLDKVARVAVFPVDTAASFCFATEQYIFVGEFFRAKDYEIDPSHAYTTPSGDAHRALVSCYPLNEDGSIADAYPLYSISIPHQVQGFAVKGDTFITSQSWGLSSSKITFYKGLGETDTTISVSGKAVPLYYLDSTNRSQTVKMPAFSEELTVVGDRVLVSFESACNKYIVGKFFFANQVISYPIP